MAMTQPTPVQNNAQAPAPAVAPLPAVSVPLARFVTAAPPAPATPNPTTLENKMVTEKNARLVRPKLGSFGDLFQPVVPIEDREAVPVADHMAAFVDAPPPPTVKTSVPSGYSRSNIVDLSAYKEALAQTQRVLADHEVSASAGNALVDIANSSVSGQLSGLAQSLRGLGLPSFERVGRLGNLGDDAIDPSLLDPTITDRPAPQEDYNANLTPEAAGITPNIDPASNYNANLTYQAAGITPSEGTKSDSTASSGSSTAGTIAASATGAAASIAAAAAGQKAGSAVLAAGGTPAQAQAAAQAAQAKALTESTPTAVYVVGGIAFATLLALIALRD